MTSGGARARSGPPPDPDAIRRDRNTDQAWVTLPAKHDGPVPPWPLTESSKREDALWERLWVTPQASQWVALNLADEVALYVRTFCEASATDGKADARTLVLRLREGLGLSTAGLARNRWRMPTQATPTKEAAKPDDRRRPSAKERLAKIVELESRRTA